MTSARLAGTRAVAPGGTGAGHCVTAGCQGCRGGPNGQPRGSAQARGTHANKSGASAVPTDPCPQPPVVSQGPRGVAVTGAVRVWLMGRGQGCGG